MTTGVRIIGGSSHDILVNYDEAIGFGRIGEYPNMAGTANQPGSISGTSMRDIWVQSDYYYDMIAYHWDGYTWTTYVCYTPEGGYHGGVHAPAIDAVHITWRDSSSQWTHFFRWTGAGFIQPIGRQWWGGACKPWTYSPTGMFVVTIGNYLGAGSHLFKVEGAVLTRDTGLADQALYGVVMLGEYPYSSTADLFVYANDGYIYRGPFNGPFVADNPTAGPFSPQNAQRAQICTDGTYIWVHDRGNNKVWKRLGVDNWVQVGGAVGASNGEMDAAVANDGTDRIYISGGYGRFWNGSSWSTINFNNNVRQGAWVFRGEISSGRTTFYNLCRDRNNPSFLHWKGDAEQSPWVTHPYSPDSLVGSGTAAYALEVFLSGEIMMAVNISGAGGLETWHFDGTSTWTRHLIVDGTNYTICRLQGTHGRNAINADEVHGCGWGPGTQLYYFKWNGTGWTATAIPGSSSATINHEYMTFQISSDGQEIWIINAQMADASAQLWHSTDGGVTWTNRAAAVIAAVGGLGSNYMRDVAMVSSTEAYVAVWETNTLSRYAQWNGTSWSALPTLPSKIGSAALHWDGTELYAVTGRWSGTGDARAYKLVAGAWVEDYDINFNGFPRAISSEEADGSRVITLASSQLDDRIAVRDPRNSADGKQWITWPYETDGNSRTDVKSLRQPSAAGKLAYRCGDGREPHRYAGQMDDGSMQSDLLISTGVQNIITFDGGQLED